jgi:hypothetical protein
MKNNKDLNIYLEVPCIVCDAKPGERCNDNGAHLLGVHAKRKHLRERLPSVSLNGTDKSLIVYYAYVMLCDSCEANSEKLFGSYKKSEDIQRRFAAEATKHLKLEGLIK